MRSMVDCPRKPTHHTVRMRVMQGAEPMIRAGDFESYASVRNSLNKVSAEEKRSEKTQKPLISSHVALAEIAKNWFCQTARM
jgi:hypothetical protein